MLTIQLMKLTDQGIKNIKAAPQRIEQATSVAEKMGGRLVGFYAVTGEYDYIIISEMPSDEAMMTFTLGLDSLGNVKTTTCHAYTLEEFKRIVQNIP